MNTSGRNIGIWRCDPPRAARVTLGGAREEVNMPNRELGTSKAPGLGGGFRPTGVLVQRWVDSAGPGRSPGRFFKRFLCDF